MHEPSKEELLEMGARVTNEIYLYSSAVDMTKGAGVIARLATTLPMLEMLAELAPPEEAKSIKSDMAMMEFSIHTFSMMTMALGILINHGVFSIDDIANAPDKNGNKLSAEDQGELRRMLGNLVFATQKLFEKADSNV